MLTSPRYIADNAQRMIRIMFYTRYATRSCEYLPVNFILHAFNQVGNIYLFSSIISVHCSYQLGFHFVKSRRIFLSLVYP